MDYSELSKAELIARLEAADEAGRALAAGRDLAVERERLVHELQVHQLELEAQNQALREAQGQLEESRSRYVDLYDFAPIAYCTFDRAGIVLEINLTGASMLGNERSRIVGKPFLALVRLEEPERFVRHIQTSLEAAIPVVSEFTLSNERGSMEVQLVSAAIANPDGTASSCRTALIDVTQRRLAEREARLAHESEKLLRGRIEAIDRASAVVSAALAGTCGPDVGALLQVIVDQARELTGAEYAALGMTGGQEQRFDSWVYSGVSRSQEIAIAHAPQGVGGVREVTSDSLQQRLRELRDQRAFAGFPSEHLPTTSSLRVPISYQGQHRGQIYLSNKLGADEFSEQDQTAITILAERAGTAMEIARLRQGEAREHKRLSLLATAGPLLAASIDYDETLGAIARLVVPAAADLSTLELLQEGGAFRTVVAHHGDPSKQRLVDTLLGITTPDRLPESVGAVIESRQPQLLDATPEFLRAGLSEPAYRELLAELNATSSILVPMVLRGRVVGVLRLVMAGSGRKYTDEDLPLAQEIATQASLAIQGAGLYRAAQVAIRARDNLLAVVCHDLRNYLSTISLGADMLAAPGPSGERHPGQKQVEAIKRSASLVNRLIDSLRDATMIETGHFTIDAKVDDVAQLVDEAVKTLEPQTERRSLRLIVQLDGRLPALHCDRPRVLQIIANLVGNAIKFSAKGGEVRIAAKPAGDAVCFSVSDTGSGIPDNELAHVFERHWSGGQDTPNGTGLGLFIAKGITEAHGGAIWAESQVGVGSTFSFTLPVALTTQLDSPPGAAQCLGDSVPS
jgi:PAS domain S-box-containing protein